MAKTATDTSIGPNSFALGLGIFENGIQTVVEALNHYAGENTTTFFSFRCLEAADPLGPNIDPHVVVFRNDATPIVRFSGEIWIDPDIQQIRIDAGAFLAASQEVDIEFTIGGGADTITLTSGSADDYEGSGIIATSSTGTGWQDFDIELTHVTGTTDCALNYLRCEGLRIVASDLPDPSP